MTEISYIEFFLGFIALGVWAYVLICIFFRQILIDRILSRGKYWHIAVIFMLVALVPFGIAAVCSLCGLHNYDLLFNTYMYSPDDVVMFQTDIKGKGESPSLISTVLYQFRGFGGHFYAGTDQGKAWALVIGILGTMLFSGLLIPSVLSVIRMRSENFLWGQARYRIQHSRYAVIIGAHEAVPELIHKILSRKGKDRIKYVILQTTNTVFYYRLELQQCISKVEEFHTVLYNGGRATAKDIEDLHIERASEVYVLGESRESDDDHDSLNIQCIRHIANVLKQKRRRDRMQCYVLFEHQSTFSAFQHSDLADIVKDQIEFISLNLYEMWAQNVLSQTRPIGQIQYQPLEGTERIDENSEKHVHLIVVGMSRMGIAMGLQAAHICHYPNFVTKGIRTRISFIDPNAEWEKDSLLAQYEPFFQQARWRFVNPTKLEEGKEAEDVAWRMPVAMPGRDTDFLDTEWEFISGNVDAPAVRAWLQKNVCNEQAITTVAICMHKAQPAQSAAIYLPSEVYRHAVQVLIYQRTSSEIVTGLAGVGKDESQRVSMRYQKLRPFGMLSHCFAKTIVDYRLAKLVNYVYWRGDDTKMQHVNDPDPNNGNLPLMESFWRQSPVTDQWSSNYNASAVATKLRFLGLDILNSPIEDIEAVFADQKTCEMLTKVEHNRWNTEKLLTGYRCLTQDEWEEFARLRNSGLDYKSYAKKKKQLRSGWEMAHLDICSMHDLEIVDQPSVEYDLILSKAFPSIVRTLRAAQ